MSPPALVDGLGTAAAVLLGLVVGSFANVCAHRLPRGLSVVAPGSACPACGAPVAWHDNVPLLSYLRLGARCRRCRLPISPAYPAMEAAHGALWGLTAAMYGPGSAALLLAAFGSAVLVLMVVDARHRILPNRITLPGLAVGLAAVGINPRVTLGEAAAGAFLGWGLPWALGAAYRGLRGREGIGMGDLKMLAMVGAFLGWKGVLFALGAGSMVGVLTGIPWALVSGAGLRAALPFGTFLGAAVLGDLLGARAALAAHMGLPG